MLCNIDYLCFRGHIGSLREVLCLRSFFERNVAAEDKSQYCISPFSVIVAGRVYFFISIAINCEMNYDFPN
jgi:hypothetical protein